jgi:NTP pyrophosphatase (non-canonical NTP hydrolase)
MMDMRTYQREALKTDRVPSEKDETGVSLIVPLLGLAGETGQLLSEYKKYLRDGNAHQLFKERVAEELGDLLWYVSNVASKYGLDLAEIAEMNLRKTSDRWGLRATSSHSFDEGFPAHERLPRRFEVELTETAVDGKVKVRAFVDGELIGNDLTDNAYDADGYRFHDVFHLGYAAVLGWSPITRSILRRKRKSDTLKDEIEDGGRAGVIEEGVAALIFDYARVHDWLEGVVDLDYDLLRRVKSVASHLEVGRCTIADWQHAILAGFSVWRQVVQRSGGRIRVDLDERAISYLGPVKATVGRTEEGADGEVT